LFGCGRGFVSVDSRKLLCSPSQLVTRVAPHPRRVVQLVGGDAGSGLAEEHWPLWGDAVWSGTGSKSFISRTASGVELGVSNTCGSEPRVRFAVPELRYIQRGRVDGGFRLQEWHGVCNGAFFAR